MGSALLLAEDNQGVAQAREHPRQQPLLEIVRDADFSQEYAETGRYQDSIRGPAHHLQVTGALQKSEQVVGIPTLAMPCVDVARLPPSGLEEGQCAAQVGDGERNVATGEGAKDLHDLAGVVGVLEHMGEHDHIEAVGLEMFGKRLDTRLSGLRELPCKANTSLVKVDPVAFVTTPGQPL